MVCNHLTGSNAFFFLQSIKVINRGCLEVVEESGTCAIQVGARIGGTDMMVI